VKNVAFDFFCIKIQAISRASDEMFFGYFFGKKGESVEYRFIDFPRKYSELAKLPLSLPCNAFRETLGEAYTRLLERSFEISEMTSEFVKYLKLQIRKAGGEPTLSLRFSHILEESNPDLLKVELEELLKHWTSQIQIQFDVQTFTSEEFSANVMKELDTQSELKKNLESRQDLWNLPDFFPTLDPMGGVSIEQFDIGGKIFCTIPAFDDEESKGKLQATYPSHFNEEGENSVPFVGSILSKENLPGNSGAVLIKVQVGGFFEAKSIILKSMRLMYDSSKLQKRFPSTDFSSEDPSFEKPLVRNQGEPGPKMKSPKKSLFSGHGQLPEYLLIGGLLIVFSGLILLVLHFFL